MARRKSRKWLVYAGAFPACCYLGEEMARTDAEATNLRRVREYGMTPYRDLEFALIAVTPDSPEHEQLGKLSDRFFHPPVPAPVPLHPLSLARRRGPVFTRETKQLDLFLDQTGGVTNV